jgi:hypothetical protein
MKIIRVGVTGGRDYKNELKVRRVLDTALESISSNTKMHLVLGDCPTGADRFATRWAVDHPDVTYTIFIAHWERDGKAAGPYRNTAMVESGMDVLLAFPGGKGTDDCRRKAFNAGVDLKVIT